MDTLAVGSRPATHLGRGVHALPAFAAALSLSAAIAHAGVAQVHWREWWAHGAFFVVCAVLQAALAALLVRRPRDWVAMYGIAGNLAVVAMYVYSRTNGSPVGPHEGVPEPPGVYDMVTTAGELVLVVALIAMLGDRAGRWALRGAFLAGAGLWIARATGVVL
jgi:hypothetical protein